MPITNLPTRTEGAGTHELGQTKLEDGSYTDATKQVKAAFWNRLLDYVIALATEVGLTDGSTPGSLRADKADKTITLTAGTGLTGGGNLSANRTFTVDIAGTNPLPLGTASPGASGKVSDRDHIHAHGALTDETLHALATATAHGFLNSQDYDSVIGKNTQWVRVWQEVLKGGLSSALSSSASGTGAGVSYLSASGRLGYLNLTTGTTSTGLARVFSNVTHWYDNAGDFLIQEVVATIEGPLPDATDDYRVRLCGLGLPNGTETGYAIVADRAAPVNPGNWQFATYNAGTPTFTDLGVALDTARHRFSTVYDRAADSVAIYIDGVLRGTVTPMPATFSSENPYPFHLLKLAGTNARRLFGEFTSCYEKYTVAR